MAGAATGRHCEIRKYDGPSEDFAKNKSKGKCPEKTKWRKSVSGNVCLDNPDVVIDRMTPQGMGNGKIVSKSRLCADTDGPPKD
jgi:hypothetical protein